MKLKIYLTILFLANIVISNAQIENRFKEVDDLISTNSMIDAMIALDKLNSNHQKDTSDAEYWLRFSKANYIFFKYEEAKFGINKAIMINPKKSDYYFEKGLLLNKAKDLDSALAALVKATQLQPKGEYYYWRGIVNQQLANNGEAEKDYRYALKKGHETPELHNNFAIILLGNEKIIESLEHIDKAILLDNKYAQAYSARSKINLYLFDVNSACKDRSTAYNLGYKNVFDIPDSVCNGSFTQQLKFVAELCAVSKLYKQGIKAYSKLIEKSISTSEYYLNRGYCYYKLKDYPNAEKDYLKALELSNPIKDLLYDNLSLLYFDQKEFVKSIEYSTKLIELNPQNHIPYIDRGLCYRKLKKYKEAEADFNRSLSIKPDFFRAFGYRSFLYLELGQYNKSYEDASKAIELNPKYGYGYIVLAQVKQKLGMRDFCIDFYNAKKYGEPDADLGIKEYCK
ncbi:tetratricopeptide repeat protein [Sporocytophaga myxococcoides]|uniref:tetratricopeptide repeat protein n=1 Tax=Sporocytophaga myxococcoides TaxID=153721 RepID=UPI00138AE71D|nr:tetratricopeptide repeat protein [Sporocytophaga myxococcoides]